MQLHLVVACYISGKSIPAIRQQTTPIQEVIDSFDIYPQSPYSNCTGQKQSLLQAMYGTDDKAAAKAQATVKQQSCTT